MNHHYFWRKTALCADRTETFLWGGEATPQKCPDTDSDRDKKRSVHAGRTLKRSLVGGLALVSRVLLWNGAAIAQPLTQSLTETPPQLLAQNQSDVTGTNPGDIPFPLTGDDDGDGHSTNEIQQTAERLSQDLEEAYAECIASQAAIADVPRRFSLGAPSNTPCISVECAALEAVLLDVRLFLSNLTELEREALQRDPSLRLW